ncbi:MAG: CysZ-type sulfate transporter [Gammaproteobacteria bacterium]|jgi:CysZ protein|nr:CysZ-type sulfate transporter [Gammaproteobacteria bacterium]
MNQQQPLNSLDYLLHGFQLIWQPGIRRYAFIPIIINLLLFIGLGILASHYFKDFLAWFNNHIPTWLQWLNPVLWILFLTVVILIATYTFTFFANLVAAPFNGLLAEQVERYLTHKIDSSPTSLLGLVKDAPRSVGRQLRYLSYFLPRAFLILLIFLIPGGQIIAPPLWFIFNGWTMALQYLDYPMDNHRVSFTVMQQQLKQQRLASLGFGITIVLFTMIPLVNLFVMPAAVAGATKLWLKNFNSAKL